MITTEQNPAWLDWAADVLGVKFIREQSTWISKLRDGEPTTVVVYTRFSTHNCEMSIATDGSRHWGSREFMRVAYSYPFEQLGLARITVVIEEDNPQSLTMCRKLGHIEEGRLKHWFGSKDGIVMRMCRDECRWIKGTR